MLAPEWCAWIAENVVRGADRSSLVRTLVASDVPRALAQRAVKEIASSPALHAVAAARTRIRQLELLLCLRRALEEPVAQPIERRSKPSAAEFFDRYWAQNRPVVFTDATRGWRLWTPQDMKRILGDTRVEVTDGREGDPDYDMNTKAHTRKTTVAAFVDRVLAAGETNDFYLVANNHAMKRRGFDKLLERIVVDETYFDPALLPRGGVSLWLGPKGTVTPLHHDTTNILFHQIHGRKQMILVPPHEHLLLEGARGFYAADDPEQLEKERRSAWKKLAAVRVILEPGEALFLPAGWWHHVRSLDVSISLSLLAFRRPNAFDWYRPGFSEGPPPPR